MSGKKNKKKSGSGVDSDETKPLYGAIQNDGNDTYVASAADSSYNTKNPGYQYQSYQTTSSPYEVDGENKKKVDDDGDDDDVPPEDRSPFGEVLNQDPENKIESILHNIDGVRIGYNACEITDDSLIVTTSTTRANGLMDYIRGVRRIGLDVLVRHTYIAKVKHMFTVSFLKPPPRSHRVDSNEGLNMFKLLLKALPMFVGFIANTCISLAEFVGLRGYDAFGAVMLLCLDVAWWTWLFAQGVTESPGIDFEHYNLLFLPGFIFLWIAALAGFCACISYFRNLPDKKIINYSVRGAFICTLLAIFLGFIIVGMSKHDTKNEGVPDWSTGQKWACDNYESHGIVDYCTKHPSECTGHSQGQFYVNFCQDKYRGSLITGIIFVFAAHVLILIALVLRIFMRHRPDELWFIIYFGGAPEDNLPMAIYVTGEDAAEKVQRIEKRFRQAQNKIRKARDESCCNKL